MPVCLSCAVVSDSMRPHGLCSLPGSSDHEILHARILVSSSIYARFTVFAVGNEKTSHLGSAEVLQEHTHSVESSHCILT